jgi:hypothetical protein
MRSTTSQKVNQYIDALKTYGLSLDENKTTPSSRELQAFVYQRIAEVSDQLPKGSEISGRVYVVPKNKKNRSHRMRAKFVIKTPDIEFEAVGESVDAYEAVNFAREATLDQLAAVRVALGKGQTSIGEGPEPGASLH